MYLYVFFSYLSSFKTLPRSSIQVFSRLSVLQQIIHKHTCIYKNNNKKLKLVYAYCLLNLQRFTRIIRTVLSNIKKFSKYHTKTYYDVSSKFEYT